MVRDRARTLLRNALCRLKLYGLLKHLIVEMRGWSSPPASPPTSFVLTYLTGIRRTSGMHEFNFYKNRIIMQIGSN